MEKDKIPVEQVINDMYDPSGGVTSCAARDYYYNNYATESEKKTMDQEDRIAHGMEILTVCLVIIATVLTVVLRN